ncbi:hypothetical protein GXM_04929 [Nostoc sphaeroides CCNUC1]|uniref:Uncharacterized protein n=1 Tax=Nostoc sphaeroides CCNUC1 TaxID=2653204 RepID=A0A5P8W3V3_9NOSO|nr:hypothetical protein GXM_04929 [Nostoc sphaeroides CCNUC1]
MLLELENHPIGFFSKINGSQSGGSKRYLGSLYPNSASGDVI